VLILKLLLPSLSYRNTAMVSEDNKALAAAAKQRGNEHFSQKTREGYEKALAAYEEAIKHNPDDHVFYANCSACHLELAGDAWEPRKKVESCARALSMAKECTSRGPTWAKGYSRRAAAEFDLISAVAKWEDRKIQDEKWRKEDEERAEKDRKEGRKPYIPERKVEPELDQALKDLVDGACYSSVEASCRKSLELEPDMLPLIRPRLQALRDAGYTTDAAQDESLRDPKAAAEFKSQGNAAFSSKKWKEAVDLYTKAMEQDCFDHVFYSNRSACNAELEAYDKALKDAERCVALNPQFAKGYSRKAHALFHEGRYVEMESVAKAGLAIDPSSTALQDLLKQAQTETCEPLEVQKQMHKLRQEKKQDAKLQDLMRGLNMQGQNVQMFNPGAGGAGDLSGLLSGLGGGGGMGGGKARMTEEQMRGMARAMSQASGQGATPSSTPSAAAPSEPAPGGPATFAPK